MSLHPHHITSLISIQSFLSREMMYSCALWSDAEGGVRGDLDTEKVPKPNDLEAAQLRKIRHVLDKARVKPGHRILEFGSGWGGLAIEVHTIHPPTSPSIDSRPRPPKTMDVKSIPSLFLKNRKSSPTRGYVLLVSKIGYVSI